MSVRFVSARMIWRNSSFGKATLTLENKRASRLGEARRRSFHDRPKRKGERALCLPKQTQHKRTLAEEPASSSSERFSGGIALWCIDNGTRATMMRQRHRASVDNLATYSTYTIITVARR